MAKIEHIQVKPPRPGKEAYGPSYNITLGGIEYFSGKVSRQCAPLKVGDDVAFSSEEGKYGPVLTRISAGGGAGTSNTSTTDPIERIEVRYLMAALMDARVEGKLTRPQAVTMVRENYRDALDILANRSADDEAPADDTQRKAVLQLAEKHGINTKGKAWKDYIMWRFPSGAETVVWADLYTDLRKVDAGKAALQIDATGRCMIVELQPS